MCDVCADALQYDVEWGASGGPKWLARDDRNSAESDEDHRDPPYNNRSWSRFETPSTELWTGSDFAWARNL